MTADPVVTDRLVGRLSLMGFTGFEEQTDRLTACIPASGFSAEVSGLLGELDIPYAIKTVPWKNWNEDWERSFSPVRVDDFCGVRASFHAPLQEVTHEIIITPRMTFGTGHHATTASMIRLMAQWPVEGKSVFDFGTGTGILAILAAKMGARAILATDNDPMALTNARENAVGNGVSSNIQFTESDRALPGQGMYDCILVNIQLGIILENLPVLTGLLVPGGRMLVSGLLAADEQELNRAAELLGLHAGVHLVDQGWVAAAFTT